MLTAINKRIANILRKAPLDKDRGAAGRRVRRRWAAPRMPSAGCTGSSRSCAARVGETIAARRYAESLRALTALSSAVDDFFERVMVMDENPERRANRLALLRDVQRLLGGVADLSRLPG